MRPTGNDGLASLIVGAAAVLRLQWACGASVSGASVSRALSVDNVAMGSTRTSRPKCQMAAVYGVQGRPGPPSPTRPRLCPGWNRSPRRDRRDHHGVEPRVWGPRRVLTSPTVMTRGIIRARMSPRRKAALNVAQSILAASSATTAMPMAS